MVFGRISLKSSIAMVRIAAEPAITYSPSKLFSTSDPTPRAPTVCAIVFRVKIAVRGLSGSSFHFDQVALTFA